MLSLFPGIKTADVYVMRAVTNRNVCFIPECGNHQVPLCHQNGKITMDTAQFSVFFSSQVTKPPELPNSGGCIQTVQYSCRLSQVASVTKLSVFDNFYWISGRCPLCGVLNMKQIQDTNFFPSSGKMFVTRFLIFITIQYSKQSTISRKTERFSFPDEISKVDN